MRSLVIVLILIAFPVSAHELWIEPKDYQPQADGKLEADIVNGQYFEGFRLSYLPRKFKTFIIANRTGAAPVKGRTGDRPALQLDGLTDGLHIIVYQSTPDTLSYSEFEKFQKFADHKGFADVRARHLARELPEKDFREVYSRYSKSLVGVGSGAGEDARMGLETEFVAIDNPYADDLSDGLRVQLFYGGAVRVNALVELFEKKPGSEASVTTHRTDVHGIVTLPVRPGYETMIDAVVLREPNAQTAKDTGAVWETLWANMTFMVPAR